MAAVRQAAAHLKRRCPRLPSSRQNRAGCRCLPERARRAGWLEQSAGAFLRFAPQTCIVPTFVRGVLWGKAVRHPLTRLKRTPEERERLGAAFQLLMHVVFDKRPLRVTVQFGRPLLPEETRGTLPEALHARRCWRGCGTHPPTRGGVER